MPTTDYTVRVTDTEVPFPAIKSTFSETQAQAFLTAQAEEIVWARGILDTADTVNGTTIHCHYMRFQLAYTDETTKTVRQPRHTYMKLGGKIYACHHLISETKASTVKLIIDTQTGERRILKTFRDDGLHDLEKEIAKNLGYRKISGTRDTNPYKGRGEGPDAENSPKIATSSATTFQFDAYLPRDIAHRQLHSSTKDCYVTPYLGVDLNIFMSEQHKQATSLDNLRQLAKLPLMLTSKLLTLHTAAATSSYRSYVHNHIKPEHVLVDDREGKIEIHFCGLSDMLPLSSKQLMHHGETVDRAEDMRQRGTPGYRAPELFSYITPRTTNYAYTTATDVFALGKTLQVLLDTLFVGEHWYAYKAHLQPIIDLMTQKEAKARPKLAEVRIAFMVRLQMHMGVEISTEMLNRMDIFNHTTDQAITLAEKLEYGAFECELANPVYIQMRDDLMKLVTFGFPPPTDFIVLRNFSTQVAPMLAYMLKHYHEAQETLKAPVQPRQYQSQLFKAAFPGKSVDEATKIVEAVEAHFKQADLFAEHALRAVKSGIDNVIHPPVRKVKKDPGATPVVEMPVQVASVM